MIAFSHTLWSETLFISLFLGALLALTGAATLPSARRSAVGGVLWGLACLTRATLLPFLPVFIGWWIWRHREQARAALLRGLLVVGVVLLVVAPWSLRNARLHGGFVAIDTNAPLNFWRGNGPDAFAGREAEETLHYAWPFDNVPV